MKYADWKTLTPDERKSLGWHRNPHIKTATLYGVAFAVTAIIIILGISKNSRIHLNRKPAANEAFETAKTFVKAHLQQPSTASFPDHNFTAVVDTAANTYQLQSTVRYINSSGKQLKSTWVIKMNFKGGDWSEAKNWQVQDIIIR